MALPIQMIHVHYQGYTLSLLDSDDHTPIYAVKIPPKAMQMSITHSYKSPYIEKPFAVASFGALSTEVKLNLYGRIIPLRRDQTFTRTYTFTEPKGETLFWKSDGILSGDFKLVDKSEIVLARFRNKVFSTTEVGSFEILGMREEEERDMIIITGLSMLAMVQSTQLGLMVIAGGQE